MARITTAGLALIAQLQAAGQTLTIDKFVYADIAGLNTDLEPPGSEVLPDVGLIVHESPVNKAGYAGSDTVVYSNMLSSAVGDFFFNWIGLYCSAHNTLVAVSYVPRQYKIKTAQFKLGNTLTKNFAIQFLNASDMTGVNLNAETWQIDLFVRLAGIDERTRLANYDKFGNKYFFDDAFKLVKSGAVYNISPGKAYIDGIRVNLAAEQALGDTGALPTDIYLDAVLAGDLSGVEAAYTVQISQAALAHYADGANQQHYLERIATINADGSVTDRRGDGTGGIFRELLDDMIDGDRLPAISEIKKGAVPLTGANPTGKKFLSNNGVWADPVYTNICNGRLTLSSGNPIADVTGAANLYFTPYNGNVITLYDESTWVVYNFTEISLSLAALAANTNYDVFIYDNAGTLTLEAVVWTDAATRATALALQNNIYVKSGDATKRYVGTIRTTATAGQCEDSQSKRFVWNMYNRETRVGMTYNSNVSWSYSTVAWREYNAGSGQVRAEVVIGLLTEAHVFPGFYALASSDIAYMSTALDGTTWSYRLGTVTIGGGPKVIGLELNPNLCSLSIGYHYITQIEQGQTGFQQTSMPAKVNFKQ